MNNQIYYKYLNIDNAIDDFRHEHVKVGDINYLNDPFELTPYLGYDFKDRQPYHSLRKKVAREVGVVSFSGLWDETLLWSHYADQHRGVVVGFEILKDEIHKVEYINDPVRQKIILSNNYEKDKKSLLNLVKVKYSKWEYENEFRIIVNFKNDCYPVQKRYFLKFADRIRIKRIILGCKFDEKMLSDILVQANRLGIEAEQARMEWKGYKINIDGTKTPKIREFQKKIKYL